MLLHHIGFLTPVSLHRALTQANESTEGFLALLGERGQYLLMPPMGSSLLHLAGHIVRQLGLEGQDPVFTQRFLELVYAYEADNQGHLSDFLDWWEKTSYKHCIQSQPIDSVTVLTVHRAKGLQFPVVLFPYADRNINPMPNSIMWWPNRLFAHHDLPFVPFNFLKGLEDGPYAEEYAQELELSMVDALNLTYVAFTRAQDRLYVFVSVNKRGSTSKISNLLSHHLEHDPGLAKYMDGSVMVYGDTQTPVRSTQMATVGMELDRLAVGTEKVTGIARPSIGLSDLYADGQEAPRLSGILAHKLLQMCLDTQDTEHSVRRAVALGLATEETQLAWKQALDHILGHEQLIQWRKEAVATYLERSVIWKGDVLRPDVIYVLPQGVIVLDFKTGTERPEDAEQVANYCRTLAGTQEWLGQEMPVNGYLLYTENLGLRQVC
jgi:ATP-dependent exoDNAse (exonuclease V) beta subunit